MKRDIMNVNKNSHQTNRQDSPLALPADAQPHLSPRIFPLLVPSSSQRLVSVFLAADKGVPWCESSAETGAQCCPALLYAQALPFLLSNGQTRTSGRGHCSRYFLGIEKTVLDSQRFRWGGPHGEFFFCLSLAFLDIQEYWNTVLYP